MDFNIFTGLVKDEVEKRVGRNYTVRIETIRKNNGVTLCGLFILSADSNIYPTVYLNRFYEQFQRKAVTLKMVVDEVMDIYEKNDIRQNLDISQFLDYETVKNRIVFKLINTEKNKELLKNIPYVQFLDLSIVFQYLLSDENIGNATILINNEHLRIWGKSVEEIQQTAQYNTPILNPYEIVPLNDIIRGFMQKDEDDIKNEVSDIIQLYVLSNKSKIYGAACMLYPKAVQDFANKVDSDLFILPSSVHEVLLLPVYGTNGAEEIKQMIQEINDTQVDPEEVLSYSVYFFDKKAEVIVML